MAAERTQAINALLIQAEVAHAEFESTELNGVYDTEWARWYAEYAVEHGIGALVGHDITAGDLADFLASNYAELERTVPRPSEPWATFIARRIAEEL